MEQRPSNRRGRGASLMMLVLLVLLVAVLVGWAWMENPLGAPQPAATAAAPPVAPSETP